MIEVKILHPLLLVVMHSSRFLTFLWHPICTYEAMQDRLGPVYHLLVMAGLEISESYRKIIYNLTKRGIYNINLLCSQALIDCTIRELFLLKCYTRP